jgi:hypothetical protein
MVLNHAVNKAKVIGRTRRSNIMHMGSMVCLSTWSRTHATAMVHVVIHARHPRHLLSEGSEWGADGSSSNESKQRTHGEQPDMRL